ncbi:hypothetical protein IAE49_11490 [Kosakonia sp. S58]|uniref:hypothetical protein n=1 Tax=unclassified Kosakonia TaxID=2632876 RepID=UPI0019065E08|nr:MULTISPECIES: hypothetical protein [unclassified Kosakonia]MBK0080112.1 hypothetical protein [Kosakonia sp. S57]MBK0086858.1 hypothetical protein [Kosakonia sp. S58]
MAEIKEVVSDLYKNFSERVKGPFYLAFIISWVGFNWIPISIFIFSKEEINVVISQVSAYKDICRQVINPLASMLFFVFVVPLFNAFYAYYHSYVSFKRDAGKELKATLIERKKVKIEAKNAKTKQEISELNLKAAENYKKNQKLILETENLKNEVGQLRQYQLETRSVQSELDALKEQNEELKKVLNKWLLGEEPYHGNLPSYMTRSERLSSLAKIPFKNNSKNNLDNEVD